MPLTAGTRLGPYEIVSLLGSGGMGEVYKALDTRLGRTVAVKILPSADVALKQRFEREARAVSSLNHPHICTLHDVGLCLANIPTAVKSLADVRFAAGAKAFRPYDDGDALIAERDTRNCRWRTRRRRAEWSQAVH